MIIGELISKVLTTAFEFAFIVGGSFVFLGIILGKADKLIEDFIK
jgi:hypothetical protein